jgi:hypothetical protein
VTGAAGDPRRRLRKGSPRPRGPVVSGRCRHVSLPSISLVSAFGVRRQSPREHCGRGAIIWRKYGSRFGAEFCGPSRDDDFTGRKRPENARGVFDFGLRLKVAGDEDRGCRAVTSAHTGAGEPVEVYGAGSSGASGLLLRARGSVSRQKAFRAASARPPGWAGFATKGLIEMEVLYERVAGLDVGKASVTVCVLRRGGDAAAGTARPGRSRPRRGRWR